ncbi:hypothetical protein OKW37_006628 [Paraburkholderia sp. MM5482-R2]
MGENTTADGAIGVGVQKSLHFCRTVDFVQIGLNLYCRIVKNAYKPMF